MPDFKKNVVLIISLGSILIISLYFYSKVKTPQISWLPQGSGINANELSGRNIDAKLQTMDAKVSELTRRLDSITKLPAILNFIKTLPKKERRVFSQNKEDGILEAIFDYIKPKSKYFVEFGTENGLQCNTRHFRENKNWKGLLMDGKYSNPKMNLHTELIYANNIVSLFQKYKVPKTFDIFSEDTDFKDFWIIKAVLDAGYRPRVIVSEINSFLSATKALTVPLNVTQTMWDGHSQYFGYSVGAGWLLAKKYNYSMIYCESAAVNCFYVIDGEEGFGKNIKLSDHIPRESLKRNPARLFHKKDTKNRPYTDVTNILRV